MVAVPQGFQGLGHVTKTGPTCVCVNVCVCVCAYDCNYCICACTCMYTYIVYSLHEQLKLLS